jgi:hypothetical protein
MPKSLLISSIFALLLSGTHALANEACLLETNADFMGVKLDIKDCIQNAGMATADFKAQCEGLSQAVVSMGGPAAKISYLSSCPVPFQAKCDHSNTAQTVFFYYKRSADEAAGLESSCGLMQGKYTKGTL